MWQCPWWCIYPNISYSVSHGFIIETLDCFFSLGQPISYISQVIQFSFYISRFSRVLRSSLWVQKNASNAITFTFLMLMSIRNKNVVPKFTLILSYRFTIDMFHSHTLSTDYHTWVLLYHNSWILMWITHSIKKFNRLL